MDDIDEIFVLNGIFFQYNYETHIDYDNKKIYFAGKNVYDNQYPIPDPRLEGNSFPVWAIIALSIVGLMAIAVLIWNFSNKKKRNSAAGLAEYEQINSTS